VLSTYLAGQRGRVLDVLIEGDGKGRTPQFTEVDMQGEGVDAAGKIIRTRITAASETRLVGEVCA
jgi:threonylcarbamoyladenosine tRNA methylthiotransferase MtaB